MQIKGGRGRAGMTWVCSSNRECINHLFPKYKNMYKGKVQERNEWASQACLSCQTFLGSPSCCWSQHYSPGRIWKSLHATKPGTQLGLQLSTTGSNGDQRTTQQCPTSPAFTACITQNKQQENPKCATWTTTNQKLSFLCSSEKLT